MSNHQPIPSAIVLDRPRPRRSILGYLTMLAALALVGGAAWAWQSGYRPPFLERTAATPVSFIEVDRGDVVAFIVENGTLESATNTVVRCEVEALMGMVGGTSGSGAGG